MPMNDQRARVSPDAAMPRARELFASGMSLSEVTSSLYGVDLPVEAYRYWGAKRTELLETITDPLNLPWDLIDLRTLGDDYEPSPWAHEQERRAFELAPRFLPLMRVSASESKCNKYIVGYDLDELHAGRNTMLGHRGDAIVLERLASSLLDLLREVVLEVLAKCEERERDPRYRADDAPPPGEIEDVRASLQLIEALQAEVAALDRR